MLSDEADNIKEYIAHVNGGTPPYAVPSEGALAKTREKPNHRAAEMAESFERGVQK